jgi:hypothetical protein
MSGRKPYLALRIRSSSETMRKGALPQALCAKKDQIIAMAIYIVPT